MKGKIFCLLIVMGFCLLLTACVNDGENTASKDNTSATSKSSDKMEEKLAKGIWRGILHLNEEKELPFNFEVSYADGACILHLINGEERIKVEDIRFENDSIFVHLPVFDSVIKGKYHERRLFGEWHNYAKGSDYKMTFYAVHGEENRFHIPTLNDTAQVAGRWQVIFISDDKKSKTDAIGEFVQEGTKVTGTFLTETGDYRYLEGIATDTMLYLSAFDGAHAFLFSALIDEDGSLKGDFWSGSHWHEKWIAYRDEEMTLGNPDSLTYLKDAAATVAFSFPNLEGKKVSLTDTKFKDKVVMVQILGSWCPNCMDETALYAEWYKKYNSKGLEIVGLAFENSDNLADVKPILTRYIKHFDVGYEVLFAGKASKKVASEALPMLNKVISFPTTIFIDKKGKVRKIHTGFNGPATSKYATFVKETERFLEGLLGE